MSTRVTRRRALAALGGGLAIESLGLAVGAGCGGSTTGELVELDVSARSDVAGGVAFVTALGWTVELSRIRVAIAALHMFEDHGVPPPEGATSTVAPGLRLLERLAPIGTAHAHPQHVAEAGIRGEMVVPAVVDLAEGAWSLGRGAGTAGAVGSGHVVFDVDDEGWAVVLEGDARRGEEARRFRARASAAELTSWHGEPEIWGCPVDRTAVEADGTLELVVRPTLWLDQVDFVTLPAGDEPVDLDPLLGMQDTFVAALSDPLGWQFHVGSGKA